METLLLRIVEISISTSLVIILVLLLSRFFNNVFIAKWKVWVWLILAVRLILPINFELVQPIVQISAPDMNAAMIKTGDVQIMTSDEIPITDSYDTVQASSKKENDYVPVKQENVKRFNLNHSITIVWFIGFILLLCKQLLTYICFRIQLKRWATVVNSSILSIANEEGHRLGIKNRVYVYQSKYVTVPMMTGLIKPILIFPDCNYTLEEYHFICRHECIHYRNKDIWIKMIGMLAAAMHWFNPMVHWLNHALAQDLELACDADVVKNHNFEYRKSYNKTILNAIDKRFTAKPLTTAFSSKKHIKQRFVNNLDMCDKRKGKLSLCLFVIFAMTIGSLVACNKEMPEAKAQEFDMNELGTHVNKPFRSLEDYQDIDYDEFIKIIQNQKYQEAVLFVQRIDEDIYFKDDAEKWLKLIMDLKLSEENHQAIKGLPNPVTVEILLDDQRIVFDLTDTQCVKVNEQVMYIQNPLAIDEILKNDKYEILTAQHFQLKDVLPFKVTDIDYIDITHKDNQTNLTAALHNQESIQKFMHQIMSIYLYDQTDDNNHINSENQEYIEARINLKDGSQAIYIPDNYAKYTMLFDGQEYAYNYASAISCIEYVAETYWRPSSSEFKNGINGPSIKINGQDLYIKTFSYHVGEDNMVDETGGRQAVELMESTVFNQETLYADIQIDADLKLYVQKSDEKLRTEIPLTIYQKKAEPNEPEHVIFMNKGFAKNYQAELPNEPGKYFVEMELNWDNGDSASYVSVYIVE